MHHPRRLIQSHLYLYLSQRLEHKIFLPFSVQAAARMSDSLRHGHMSC